MWSRCKTANSARGWRTDECVQDIVHIGGNAARYPATTGVQTIEVNDLSVGGFQVDGVDTHHTLLKASIWIIERLNLSHVQPLRYNLICLPLRIVGGDGAPARAVLRRIGSTDRNENDMNAVALRSSASTRERCGGAGPSRRLGSSPL